MVWCPFWVAFDAILRRAVCELEPAKTDCSSSASFPEATVRIELRTGSGCGGSEKPQENRTGLVTHGIDLRE